MMEDCLHTSSENLSKLVRWAHSHGTICTLIPGLKHLLTEGSHGNLTAMWGCSAGHAYHWPLPAACRSGPKERAACYQDSRSINSDSLQGATSAAQSSPGGERFLGRASKAAGDCSQTRDSCDFSNCSEPSEDNGEDEYGTGLFDIVCESSATDEDGDYEPPPAGKKRVSPGMTAAQQRAENTAVKKIKQETAEDYYTVANARLPQRSSSGEKETLQLGTSSPHTARAQRGAAFGAQGTAKPSPRPPEPSAGHGPSLGGPPGGVLPGQGELIDSLTGEVLLKPGGSVTGPYGELTASPTDVNPDVELMTAQSLTPELKGEAAAVPALYEIERLKALLQAERNRSELMGETISGLKQDKELLQQELTKKAELICDFLQDQLRPDKRRGHSSQMEAGSSHMAVFSDEAPTLFDSFEEVELHPIDRPRGMKSSKRSRDGENTRVRMKNVVGVIARYMAALQEFRRSVSMKVAFDRVGVDRNTISRTAAIAELSLAAPEVFHALPPWDEKEETLAHYAHRCRQAMDDNIKAKIKTMKAKGDLLPIVSK